MTEPVSRLYASHEALLKILAPAPDLRRGAALDTILEILAERRGMALTDLSPSTQAELIAGRSAQVLPGVEQLTALLAGARAEGRKLTVKFGIDPTAADVHVGHTVPMRLASRFQRMGHRVVFIVGDITAKIGDPTGRSVDRPQLTDEDIQRNLATYRRQVSPFFDFERAEFRFNSEWLAPITLPRFLGVLEKLPASAALQREDFRARLAAGSGLSMAELVYSVVMALDSVELEADIELGGLDQLLNMQMCRRVMETSGQRPEVIIATGLIEGTDGTGTKMSKSKGNYVGLAFDPKDVFGKLMSAADRLLPDYLRTLTELLEPEVELLLALAAERRIHPMGLKTLLAADVTATIHGFEAATEARTAFHTQFSARRYSQTPGIPTADARQTRDTSVAALFVQLTDAVPSLNHVRRVAAGGGLRLIIETGDSAQETITLAAADADRTPAELLAEHCEKTASETASSIFLRCGRHLLAITRAG
jgi:tyrosyl-tRNA synthetase